MAVHTEVPRGDLDAFLHDYGLPPADVVAGIAAGVENTNYFVDTGGRALVLTLYEGRTALGDLPYFLALTGHAAAQGVPMPAPVLRADGAALGCLCGRPAALLARLPGATPDAPSLPQAEAAGAALAGMHAALGNFEMRRVNPLGPGAWAAMAERLPAADEALAAARAVAKGWPDHLPVGPIHTDLFPDNVLFEGSRVSGVIDPYFACDGPLAYDLAVAMNAFAQEHPGGFDPARGRALRRGYETVRPLLAAERAALPRLAQGAALRFYLTRLEDAQHRTASALVTVKDPLPYLALARHHAAASFARNA